MPDLNQKRSGYGQRKARIGPDCICLIQLPASNSVPFFRRRHGSYCAKLIHIRSGWPGLGLAKHIWSGSKPVCRNHHARFLAAHNQPTTRFPLARLHSSTYLLDHTVQKQPGSNLVLANRQVWAKRIWSRSKLVWIMCTGISSWRASEGTACPWWFMFLGSVWALVDYTRLTD